MRLLVLTHWDNDATYFYRLQPIFYLDHPEIRVERKPYQGQISYSFFNGYTHLIMERPSSWEDLNVIKLAKQWGLYVITDWDDDCLHLDGYNPMFQHYEASKETLIDCINESDEVWVSTEGVKRSFQMFNRNMHVIPNAHNDYLFLPENKVPFNQYNRVAMWRGGGSHEADMYEKIEKTVKLVNDNDSEDDEKRWDFYFCGFRFVFMEMRCGDNYYPVSLMPLGQYFEFIQKTNPQIVFHPLRDTVFNRGKSNIAWMESTYAGAAFFGNKAMPEFDRPFISDMKLLPKAISEHHVNYLKEKNEQSWEYILDNLLLSNVNKLREKRLLSD